MLEKEARQSIRCFILSTVVFMTACGGGGGGSGTAPPPTTIPGDTTTTDSGDYNPFAGGFSAVSPAASNNHLQTHCKAVGAPPTGNVKGSIFFQRVPLSPSGLNFSAMFNAPARGVVVEAVDASGGSCSNTVLATTLTDGNGAYGLTVSGTQPICVQVRAQMFRTGTPSWDMQVNDNAQANSPYYLRLSAPVTDFSVSAPDVDLVAGSGWDNASSSYTGDRAAAWFAILDSACEALDTVLATDSSLQFPTLHFRWGVNNVPAEGKISDGEILGPFYQKTFTINSSNGEIIDSVNEIFLLGDSDTDTDEFDQHVIVHEIGHYITQSFARSDSVGGSHSLGDKLDASVAFDEGWASAFAGIVLESADPAAVPAPSVFQNTAQVGGFSFPLSTRPATFEPSVGWYSEASVQTFVYNLFDSNNSDTADNLTLSFAQLFRALREQRNVDAAADLFSYIHLLKVGNSVLAADIDLLAAAENLEAVTDDFGSSESRLNNPEVQNSLDVFPLYTELSLGVDTVVCSNDQFGRNNKLSVRQRLYFDALSSRGHTFTVTPNGIGKPGLDVLRRGDLLASNVQEASTVLQVPMNLTGSERYILWLYDADNASSTNGATGRHCFTVRVD